MVIHAFHKKINIDRYTIISAVMIIIATLLRLILIYNNWPPTNSDEGNMGVLGLHVAYRGEWPIFFYGLPYLGPVEGYIAAPLFHLFGTSLFVLRLGLLPFFVVFAASMYVLTKRLYTKKFALFILLILCVGSSETVQRQLRAVGEYPEIVAFAALISLLVVWFAQTQPTLEGRRTTWGRCVLYVLLGVLMGMAIWVDMLILPLVGTALLLLVLFCRREVLSWAGIALLVGLMLGGVPLIIYNVTAPLSQNSIATLIWITQQRADAGYTFVQQLLGTVGISVPDVMNFVPSCAPDPSSLVDGQHIACSVAQLSYGTGSLLILFLALVFAACSLWRLWQSVRVPHTSIWQAVRRPAFSEEQRLLAIRYAAGVMLLISAVVTLVSYLKSAGPALTPAPTARYLIIFLVALPAMLWPLWRGASMWAHAAISGLPGRLVLPAVSGALLLIFLVVSSYGLLNTFQGLPGAQKSYQAQVDIVQHLEKIGATRIYSEYWTCNNLTFQSRERIICAALNGDLSHGFDRYMPYRTTVEAVKNPAYIFPKGIPQVAALDQKLSSQTLNSHYHREEYGNYVIYYVP